MKGQYIAIETVLTFALGLVAAVGIISIFDSYSSDVYDTSERVEANIVQEEILKNVNTLRPVRGEGHIEFDLPEKISNRDYQVVADDRIYVEVGSSEYSTKIPVEDDIEGSASGEVRLEKTQSGFELVDR